MFKTGRNLAAVVVLAAAGFAWTVPASAATTPPPPGSVLSCTMSFSELSATSSIGSHQAQIDGSGSCITSAGETVPATMSGLDGAFGCPFTSAFGLGLPSKNALYNLLWQQPVGLPVSTVSFLVPVLANGTPYTQATVGTLTASANVPVGVATATYTETCSVHGIDNVETAKGSALFVFTVPN
jgi:hypothetical protein